MPCGPATQAYSLTYFASTIPVEGGQLKNIVNYSLDVYWSELAKWLMKQVPKWQIYHRSKQHAISASFLRVNEHIKSVQRTKEWHSQYLQYRLRPQLNRTIYNMVMEKTLKYMTLDYDRISEYIRDHKDSSMAPGVKWVNAYTLDKADWTNVYNIQRSNIEMLLRSPGYFNAAKFNSGIRGRGEELPHTQGHYEGEIDRSRKVQYLSSLSVGTVFIKDKASWYGEILNEVEKLIGTSTTFHYPFVLGGKIFLKAAELFDRYGSNFKAYDGKNWEASVGEILGPDFSPLMMHTDGVNILPSGITFTSLLGTIANVIVNKDVGGEIISLGDDMNRWGFKQDIAPPFIEYQEEDTANRYVLGNSFRMASERPVLCGLKVMMDRAYKAIGLSYSELPQTVNQVRRNRPSEDILWAAMWFGRFGKRTLLEALVNLPPGMDYFAPGEIMEKMYVRGQLDYNPLELAEELGFKSYVVA